MDRAAKSVPGATHKLHSLSARQSVVSMRHCFFSTSVSPVPRGAEAVEPAYQHVFDLVEDHGWPRTLEQVRREHQRRQAVGSIYRLLAFDACSVVRVVWPAAVFEQDSVAAKLEIRVPQPGPAVFHDRHRLLVLETQAVTREHSGNLELAPAPIPALPAVRAPSP